MESVMRIMASSSAQARRSHKQRQSGAGADWIARLRG